MAHVYNYKGMYHILLMTNYQDNYKQHGWEKDIYREDGSWKHWSDF